MHQQNEHLLTSDSLQNNCLFVAPKLIFHAAQRTRCLTLLLCMPHSSAIQKCIYFSMSISKYSRKSMLYFAAIVIPSPLHGIKVTVDCYIKVVERWQEYFAA